MLATFKRMIWGEEPDPIVNNPLANATTPDQLIGAALVESFAKEFDDWSHEQYNTYNRSTSDDNVWLEKWRNRGFKSVQTYDTNFFYNSKKKLLIVYRKNGNIRSNFRVNDVPLSTVIGETVIEEYVKLEQQVKEAKAAAAKAKREMEENEAKWNLAEKLLGKKRNEHGALVPIVPASEYANTQHDKSVNDDPSHSGWLVG